MLCRECFRQVHARGLCTRHYQRWKRRHGEVKTCKHCRLQKPLWARGLCWSCYKLASVYGEIRGYRGPLLPRYPPRQEAERRRRLEVYCQQFAASGALDYREAQRLP